MLDYEEYTSQFMGSRSRKLRLPVMQNADIKAMSINFAAANNLKVGDILYSNFVSFKMPDGSVEPGRAVVLKTCAPNSIGRREFCVQIRILYGDMRKAEIDAGTQSLWRTTPEEFRVRRPVRPVVCEEAVVVEAVGRIRRNRTQVAVRGSGRVRPVK